MPDSSHRRFDPLLREWVLVSPQRLSRPWLGRVESDAREARPAYDPDCYLCPGNARAGATRNPPYEGTFVFDNDFPALTLDASDSRPTTTRSPLLVSRPERGICRVVCFSPRHDLSLAALSNADLQRVVDVWAEQYAELGKRPEIAYVQIFENRGAAMGASNPHPHGQIWATETVPDIPRREQEALAAHRGSFGTCLLCEYASTELRAEERTVAADEHFVAVVPFWAVWPFETLILPRRHATGIDMLTEVERGAFARMLKAVAARYDGLFDAPCPYSMGIHQRPTDGDAHREWHLHVHFYPPVLRSAVVHKFMVGFELLGSPQRDLTPEDAAARLRGIRGAEL
jgi:UDPglucose--hexose-1-phosphate uridylyltransferase